VGQKSNTKEPAKAFVKDGIYVPIRFVSQTTKEKLDEEYTHHLFKKEEVCENCDYGPDRVCDVCESCANYTGTIKLFSYKKVDDKKYLRLPYGLKEETSTILNRKVEFKERDRSRPMQKVPKFVAELRPDQKDCVRAMIKAEHGVLRSPPRSGKTVMGSAFVCKLGEKTLILAAQKDWLDNFYETFVGSDTQAPMTNIKKKRIGFPKKLAEFEQMDVCLCTYQMFLKPKGRKLLKKIRKMFGILLIDEVQTVGAPELAQIVNGLDVRYKIGVSGTPERKDQKELLIYGLLGPVFYTNEVKRLKPRLEVKQSGFKGPVPQSWTYIVRKLENDPKRLKVIAQEAIADVKAGHLVVIPFTRIPVIKALTRAINKLHGKRIAAEFHGGVKKEDRKAVIERARDYKFKVVVGNTSLLSTGINIPRASMLYQVTPASNIPKAQQRFSRVLTPMEGKPNPVIKYFLDDVDVVRRCMQKEHWQCMIPMFKPMISDKVKEQLSQYFKGSSSAKEKWRRVGRNL
jgi:superfamily II DNA or RNA helicase